MGWDFRTPAPCAGADRAFSFSTPPTQPVCPALLPASEAEKLPMLRARRVPSPSCVGLCAGAPTSTGRDWHAAPPPLRALPTPNLSLLAAVGRDGGWRSWGMRGRGLILRQAGRGGRGQRGRGGRTAAASAGERAAKKQASSACLSASEEAEQGNDRSL